MPQTEANRAMQMNYSEAKMSIGLVDRCLYFVQIGY